MCVCVCDTFLWLCEEWHFERKPRGLEAVVEAEVEASG